MLSAAPTVLVVGGGLTGAAVGRALCRSLPAENVFVWEALDCIGGRFHTERPASGGACDTGAQYVTVTDDAAVAAENAPLCSELTAAGILAPLRGRIQGGRAADGSGANYIAPQGLSAIVSHLFASSGLRPTCSRRAAQLRRASSARGWEVRAADGFVQTFDGVVLTQPVPEQLALLDTGEAAAWLDAPGSGKGGGCGDEGSAIVCRASLEAVQYSSRFALSLFFPPSAREVLSAHADWVARYVAKEEDDALVYIGWDSAKRAARPDEPPSLIVHTSVPYGIRILKRRGSGGAGGEAVATTAVTYDEAEVTTDLLSRTRKLLPWLPPHELAVLKAWRISQVRTPLALPLGGACLCLAPSSAVETAGAGTAEGGGGAPPPLVLAGDAFSPLGSRFDGCVQSGEQAAKELLAALQQHM